MGKTGFRNPDIVQAQEDKDFAKYLVKEYQCSTEAELTRWMIRFIYDRVSAAEFAEYIRQQQDARDAAKYDADDAALRLKRASQAA